MITNTYRQFTNTRSSGSTDVTGEASAAIKDMIKNSAANKNETISTLVGAVFGKQGQSQDIIPQGMRLGQVSSEQIISAS